jgi:hypothetical protein
MRAFWAAVSRVKGGSGGRDMRFLRIGDPRILYRSVQRVNR